MSQDDLNKVGTDKAKKERLAQIAMAKEVHNEVFGKLIGEQSRMANEEPNWALYNYILQVVNFNDCDTMQQALHKMYRQLWPHIKKYHNDREVLLNNEYGISNEARLEDYGMAPLTMAEITLQKVSEAARQRARMNKYDIHVPKTKLELI